MEDADVDVEGLAELVREHRRERALNLRDAAQECGVSFNALSRVERGQLPDLRTFARLGRWIEFDANDLLGI